MRRRLDLELVRRGLASSRSEGRDAILAGRVLVGGSVAGKPGSLVAPADPVTVRGASRPYASRAGEKVAAALDRFGVDPAERWCLDAGASTGGFTDVLLRRGAAHVVALDVGYGQLAWGLREDPRVTVMERFNVRGLRPEHLARSPQLIVADLSFISLRLAIAPLVGVAADRADLIVLVKPQFEAGRREVGRGGVVSDPSVWARAIEAVAEACRRAGAGPLEAMPSPVRGPKGNVEFPLHARVGEPGVVLDAAAVVREVAA